MKQDNFEIINPLKGISGFSWFFEQAVYSSKGLVRALKSEQGSGNIPKVIVKNERKQN